LTKAWSGWARACFPTIIGEAATLPLRAALIADKSSADDLIATALANLPVSDPYSAGPTGWYAPSAEAKALGLAVGNSDPAGDGTYTFDNTRTYTYDPNNRAVSGKFDFIGVTEHEFSELMGHVTQLANTGFGYDILDTMRFTAPGAVNRTVAPRRLRRLLFVR